MAEKRVNNNFAKYISSENEPVGDNGAQRPGSIKTEQVLMIKEIYKNTEFTCHARNEVGSTKRVINVVVAGAAFPWAIHLIQIQI